MVLQKSPSDVPANVKLHLRYPSTYQDYALKHGAIGVLLCNYENNPARFKVGANFSLLGGSNVSIKPNGKLTPSANYMGGNIQVAGSITVDVLKELMKANGLNLEEIWKNLEKGNYTSKPLNTTASIAYGSIYSDIESYNVIGKIEGTDKN